MRSAPPPWLFAAILWLSLAPPGHAAPPTPPASPEDTELSTDDPEEAPPPDAETRELEDLRASEEIFQARLRDAAREQNPFPDDAFDGDAPAVASPLYRPDPSAHDDLRARPDSERPRGLLPQGATLASSSLVPLSIPHQPDPMIDAYIKFFLTDGRRFMQRALERQAKYLPMMERVFQEEGVPTDLFGVGIIESGYNPRAYSYAHASGIWQFIASTGRSYGLRADVWIDERRNPEKATRAAARHLRDLHKSYGSWELALAAYNAGGGAVLSNCRKYNTNDFWTIAHLGGFADQTRNYVPKAIAAALVMRNATAYGFKGLKYEPAWEFDLAHIPAGQISVKVLAKAAGLDEKAFLDYNPELLRGFTPPEAPEYFVRLPKNTGAAFEQKLATLWPSERLTFGRHIVRQGEALSDIADHYGVSSDTLRDLNGLDPKENLVGGTTVLIPMRHEIPPPPPTYDEGGSVNAAFPNEFSYPGRRTAYYRVRRRDTLENLSRAFEVEPHEIALWNSLDENATLISGLVLRLYLPESFDPARAILIDPEKIKAVLREEGLSAKGSSLLYEEKRRPSKSKHKAKPKSRSKKKSR